MGSLETPIYNSGGEKTQPMDVGGQSWGLPGIQSQLETEQRSLDKMLGVQELAMRSPEPRAPKLLDI
jgi:hypothetical protein